MERRSEWTAQTRDALDGQRLTVHRLDDGTGVVLDIEGKRLMTLNSTALRLVDWIGQGISSPSGLTPIRVDSNTP